MGATAKRLQAENKHKQLILQQTADASSYWQTHTDESKLPSTQLLQNSTSYQNSMCPLGLALDHTTAAHLNKWSRLGCPTMIGKPWTKLQLTTAIRRGPYSSALTPTAMVHFANKMKQKVACGQAKLICWRDIRNNPPAELKISPISAIPHKSKPYQSILNLSFTLRLQDTMAIPLVNKSTVKTGPKGAVNQLGNLFLQIIHAFAETDDKAKISWQSRT